MVSVGSVTVDVVPDARRFDSTLGAQITPQANRIGEQIGKQIADQISKGLRKGLGDWPADNPAKEPAKRKGDEAAGSFGDAFKGRLKASLADLPDIKIGADSSEADRALMTVRTELQALHNAKLGVDISTTDALAKADALKARLDAIGANSADIRLRVDTQAASAELDKFLAEYRVKTEAASEAAGEENGSLLAKGMHDSFVRNSPLIAAAVAGGLIAGAPAVLAGAGILFGGVAAAAVHSNQQVQQAFNTTKDAISKTFTDAASVTVPMFVGALGRLGTAVQGLGPQLRTAFTALAGPLDSLTTGIINMADNAMPGLVAAVQNSGPVFTGLASLLGSIGTGIGQMFQILSEHSAAAGTVLSSLGSILGSLLPIIGQLVGAGATLGSQILPPIASALRLVADALNLIAPVLPAVLAGFLGFKVVGTLAGPLEALSGKLASVAAQGGALSSVSGKLATATGGLATGLPVVAAAAGFIAVAYETWTAAADEARKSQLLLGKALDEGGVAAQGATQAIKTYNDTALGKMLNALPEGITSMKLFGHSLDDLKMNAGTANAAFKTWYDSLTPLDQKQQDVTASTDDLEQAIKKYGPASGQAAGAAVDLKDKQQALTDAQNQLMQATHGVTQAMMDQASEALAAADSGFALQRATLAAKDAQLAMVDAIKKHGPASEEAQKATLDFNQALLQQAEAAGKAAADQSGLTDKVDLAKVSNAATLKSLLDLKQQYGAEFPAALQATIDKLQAAGVKVDDVGAKKAVPTVDANTAPLDAKTLAANGQLNDLAAKHTEPVVTLNKAPFDANYLAGLNNLGILDRARANPTASLVDNASAHLLTIKGYIDALHDKTITINTNLNTTYSGATAPGSGSSKPIATGGRIGSVPSKRFSAGGLVRGPGGPTDDRVGPFWSPSGAVFLSNDETVVKAASSLKYGPQKMAAINAGTALVSMPTAGLYNGGGEPELASVGSSSPQMSAGSSGSSQPAQFTGNLFLDSGEFLGKVRGEATTVVSGALNTMHNAIAYGG